MSKASCILFLILIKTIPLQIELAAIVDWGEPFVKATYRLDSDGATGI
jgi:hypothetical protein